ncbi:hypothetical protein GCM10009129_18900 [Psychrobacter aestuarii]|uniref:DNA-binding protein n=1 Tax=Psychrobacter aestuarii TaxID=556327 RepID=A0ABP3FMB4_9GAMM
MSLEKVTDNPTATTDTRSASNGSVTGNAAEKASPNYSKLTTAKLAKELGLKTQDLNDKLVEKGYLNEEDGNLVLTDAGRQAGGISKTGKFGEFCLWNADMAV